MPKKDRARIDYMPGSAAFEALGIAGAMFPDMRPQALIDKYARAKPFTLALRFAKDLPENGKVTAMFRQGLLPGNVGLNNGG